MLIPLTWLSARHVGMLGLGCSLLHFHIQFSNPIAHNFHCWTHTTILFVLLITHHIVHLQWDDSAPSLPQHALPINLIEPCNQTVCMTTFTSRLSLPQQQLRFCPLPALIAEPAKSLSCSPLPPAPTMRMEGSCPHLLQDDACVKTTAMHASHSLCPHNAASAIIANNNEGRAAPMHSCW